ncbi:unnamed protein product [Trichobilharzia szidati]|nr:unnamed protein product [Trichobilharzia szidati]
MGNQSSTSAHETESVIIEVPNDTNIRYQSARNTDNSNTQTGPQIRVILGGVDPQNDPATRIRNISIRNTGSSNDKSGPQNTVTIEVPNDTNIRYQSARNTDNSNTQTDPQIRPIHRATLTEIPPATTKLDQSFQASQISAISRAIQTVDPPADASVQVDLLTRSQSEVTRTEPEIALEISNPPTSVDASVESVEQSGIREQPADAFNTFRVYLLNLLPISVLSDESSLKKLSDCLICMENYHIGDRVMGLPCFHMFHHRCLCTWTEENLQCPVCRIPIYIVN